MDLENYRILKSLGSGAFGSVKRNIKLVAQHILTNTLVAIKIIKKQLAKEQGVLGRIKYEALTLKKFNNEHIIKL